MSRADRHGVNGVTGDYSRGASGFLITTASSAAGARDHIAGNLADMFRQLTAADDLELIAPSRCRRCWSRG